MRPKKHGFKVRKFTLYPTGIIRRLIIVVEMILRMMTYLTATAKKEAEMGKQKSNSHNNIYSCWISCHSNLEPMQKARRLQIVKPVKNNDKDTKTNLSTLKQLETNQIFLNNM